MKSVHVGMLAGALLGSLALGAAQAQTAGTSGGAAPSAPTAGSTGTATGGTGTGGMNRPMATSPGTGTTSMGTPPAGPSGTARDMVNRNTGTAAASGNTNQAVATTSANAPQPARGRNSFTMGEARRRIERNGYAQVADLRKDGNGVWRGHAQKDGATVNVWLDYKGNVGTN